jgi:hypothetical protein
LTYLFQVQRQYIVTQMNKILHWITSLKGVGTSVAVLQVSYSYCQKCSKVGTYTTDGIKNNFYYRGFSISLRPGPCITGWVWIIFTIFKPCFKNSTSLSSQNIPWATSVKLVHTLNNNFYLRGFSTSITDAYG